MKNFSRKTPKDVQKTHKKLTDEFYSLDASDLFNKKKETKNSTKTHDPAKRRQKFREESEEKNLV